MKDIVGNLRLVVQKWNIELVEECKGNRSRRFQGEGSRETLLGAIGLLISAEIVYTNRTVSRTSMENKADRASVLANGHSLLGGSGILGKKVNYHGE